MPKCHLKDLACIIKDEPSHHVIEDPAQKKAIHSMQLF